jgi:hypothetical protein
MDFTAIQNCQINLTQRNTDSVHQSRILHDAKQNATITINMLYNNLCIRELWFQMRSKLFKLLFFLQRLGFVGLLYPTGFSPNISRTFVIYIPMRNLIEIHRVFSSKKQTVFPLFFYFIYLVHNTVSVRTVKTQACSSFHYNIRYDIIVQCNLAEITTDESLSQKTSREV